jgi:rRNA-processing protein FCF1
MSSTGRPSGSRSADPERRRRLVLLDANALFLPESDGTDLESEVARLGELTELRVPTSVLGELDRLCDRGVTGATTARALAARIPRLRCPGRGDDAIVTAAVRRSAWVVTGDRGLAQRLVAEGITVLAPRAGGRLVRIRPSAAVRPGPRTIVGRSRQRVDLRPP